MKFTFLPVLAAVFCASATLSQADSDISRSVARTFGQPTADNILLLRGSGTTGDPVEWTVFARDPFRSSELLRIQVAWAGSSWQASPAGAGNVLNPVPTSVVNFQRLRYSSADARISAAKAAVMAKTTFSSVNYQLASNADTGVPEWGLALLDETGYEVGFCVVSGDSGAVTFQDWTPKYVGEKRGLFTRRDPETEGERAAKSVKRTARKAWNWTDNARQETRSFFKELFR